MSDNSDYDIYGDATQCDYCGQWDFTGKRITTLEARVEELSRLLKLSKCPASCLDGSIPHQVGDHEWESEQCQFCYEREKALKEPGE